MTTTPRRSPSPSSVVARLLAATILVAACSAGTTTSAGPTASAVPTTSPRPTPLVASAVPTVQPTATLPVAVFKAIPLPGGPNTIAITRDRVWVELHRDNSLASVDPKTSAIATYPDVQVHCYIAGDGADRVWTTYHIDSLVTLVDARSGKIAHTVTIPDACGVGATTSQVWVTSPSAGQIYRLDPATGAIRFKRAVDGSPFVVTPAGGLVYASGEGGGGWLEAIDPADGHSVGKRQVPDVELVDVVALGFDSLWVTGRTSTKLYRLDPRSLDIRATIEIGDEPSGVAVGRDAVWVAQLGGRLTRVDPATNAPTGRWSMPFTFLAWPTVAFGRLWLTSLDDNALISIDPAALSTP
jgi:streptogramin lyase